MGDPVFLREGKEVLPVSEIPVETHRAIACCHSLVQLEDGTIVGDPLEKAMLTAVDWTLTKGKSQILPFPWNSGLIQVGKATLELKNSHFQGGRIPDFPLCGFFFPSTLQIWGKSGMNGLWKFGI